MKCPACDQDMDKGRASVESTGWRFLAIGMSCEDLSFRKRESNGEYGERQLVIGSGDYRDAWNCAKCEVTLIDRNGSLS